jgi:hypothetical protein
MANQKTEDQPKGYASETKVSELQSVGTFPQGRGNAPSAGELAEQGRRNAEAQRKDAESAKDES